MWDGDQGDCPICGYPHYLGVYFKGGACGKCGYIDLVAAAKLKYKDLESKARIKRNKENPPKFKSVEDWENNQ